MQGQCGDHGIAGAGDIVDLPRHRRNTETASILSQQQLIPSFAAGNQNRLGHPNR